MLTTTHVFEARTAGDDSRRRRRGEKNWDVWRSMRKGVELLTTTHQLETRTSSDDGGQPTGKARAKGVAPALPGGILQLGRVGRGRPQR